MLRPVTTDQSMLDLWLTKWHCDRFLSLYFGLPCQAHVMYR